MPVRPITPMQTPPGGIPQATILAADDEWLQSLARAAFGYFLEQTHPRSGLVADTSRERSPSSIAVVGLALSAYPIAVERGWLARKAAVERVLTALRFFRDSDQSGEPSATGYKGFYYHFLDMESGRRVWQSELSMIDTALLMAGVLTARCYFDAQSSEEVELRELADFLYRRVDWQWAMAGCDTLRQGWKPECGFLHYGWEGYSEAIVLYALAAASPTFPIPAGGYDGWTATYQWENQYGYDCLYAGPLFVHHFSHAWIDFRGIRDDFMRAKRSDYFENSRRACCIQREYALRNPHECAGYGANGWGLSACDGPTGDLVRPSGTRRALLGYAARGVPYGPDDGTLCIPSVLTSLPFVPEIALTTTRELLKRYPEAMIQGRITSAINPGVRADGRAWVSPGHYGLDQGIVLLMIENHRSGLIWTITRRCPYLRTGLLRTGFRGDWLHRSGGRRHR